PDPVLLDTPKTRREMRRLLDEARVASQKKGASSGAGELPSQLCCGALKIPTVDHRNSPVVERGGEPVLSVDQVVVITS
ncbi:MAG: hypothetical protein M3487_10500, partial [Actinomycetota bacterium]|nr:hypothetical protein [Actinomycetota bacterium]